MISAAETPVTIISVTGGDLDCSLVEQRNKEKSQEGHYPGEIDRMGKIDAFEECGNLREYEPEGKRRHRHNERPQGMSSPAYSRSEQCHQCHERIRGSKAQTDKQSLENARNGKREH